MDRQRELQSLMTLNSRNLAPPLIGVFANGFLCGYYPGMPSSPEQLRDPRIYSKIAERFEYHPKNHVSKIIRNSEHHNKQKKKEGYNRAGVREG